MKEDRLSTFEYLSGLRNGLNFETAWDPTNM